MLNPHHGSSRLMAVAQQQARAMTLHHSHLGHHSAVTSNAQVHISYYVLLGIERYGGSEETFSGLREVVQQKCCLGGAFQKRFPAVTKI